MTENTDRLLKSRKLWGALVGSLTILAALKLGAPETSTTAITALGALWTTAIAGQGVADAMAAKK